jgi:hypothetical protein
VDTAMSVMTIAMRFMGSSGLSVRVEALAVFEHYSPVLLPLPYLSNNRIAFSVKAKHVEHGRIQLRLDRLGRTWVVPATPALVSAP